MFNKTGKSTSLGVLSDTDKAQKKSLFAKIKQALNPTPDQAFEEIMKAVDAAKKNKKD